MKELLMRMAVVLGIVAAFVLLWSLYRSEYHERERLENNQHALLSDTQFYRTRDSLSAASVERLTLSNREFREYAGELEKIIGELQLKVRRLQSVARTAVTMERGIETIVRDTVIVRDSSRTDTVRFVNFVDPWLTFEGTLLHDRFMGHIESRDTLIQIVHRVPRKFWFIRWGTKAIRQEVVCKNPYSRVSYTEYIELKK